MTIIARSVWGAKQASLPKDPMRLPASQLYVHHSVTDVTDDPYADMRTIERINMADYGHFAYSYVIHPKNGEILEGAGLRKGAHTKRSNSTSFGVCHVGNYQDRNPNVQQIESTRWLIGHLTDQGWLLPGADILGHRDLILDGKPYATACPGNKLYAVLDMIRYPWEETMPDNPDLPNLPDIKFFIPIVNAQTGEARGYYIVSSDGQLHAFGPGAPFFGRSEVPSQ